MKPRAKSSETDAAFRDATLRRWRREDRAAKRKQERFLAEPEPMGKPYARIRAMACIDADRDAVFSLPHMLFAGCRGLAGRGEPMNTRDALRSLRAFYCRAAGGKEIHGEELLRGVSRIEANIRARVYWRAFVRRQLAVRAASDRRLPFDGRLAGIAAGEHVLAVARPEVPAASLAHAVKELQIGGALGNDFDLALFVAASVLAVRGIMHTPTAAEIRAAADILDRAQQHAESQAEAGAA